MSIPENERWILSYYRNSEISGSLFFGRLARALRAGPIQRDLSKHFADEAQHAWYWTKCLDELDSSPIKMSEAYQDQYLEAVGLPSNLMEVLAITQIFERRVINQYTKHLAAADISLPVESTLKKIMEDEVWHIQWVRDALIDLEPKFGKDHIAETIKRFRDADREIYAKTLAEHEQRLDVLLSKPTKEKESQ